MLEEQMKDSMGKTSPMGLVSPCYRMDKQQKARKMFNLQMGMTEV